MLIRTLILESIHVHPGYWTPALCRFQSFILPAGERAKKKKEQQEVFRLVHLVGEYIDRQSSQSLERYDTVESCFQLTSAVRDIFEKKKFITYFWPFIAIDARFTSVAPFHFVLTSLKKKTNFTVLGWTDCVRLAGGRRPAKVTVSWPLPVVTSLTQHNVRSQETIPNIYTCNHPTAVF